MSTQIITCEEFPDREHKYAVVANQITHIETDSRQDNCLHVHMTCGKMVSICGKMDEFLKMWMDLSARG